MADHPFAALLRAGAEALDDPTLERLTADLSAPMRVGVAGRLGSGRDTVRRALRGAGAVVADPGKPADIDVYLGVETLTREDIDALAAAPRPAVAVLNKADLSGFRGAGPMVVAAERCRGLERDTGVPILPLAGLLAVAACDPAVLDPPLVEALRTVLVEPARLSPPIRRRMLAELDFFGIAIAAEAVCGGADHAELAARLREVSGLPAVLDAIGRVGAPIRYRRLITALAGLAGRAVGRRGIPVAEFLAGDAVVLARMHAATDAMADSGPAASGGPADVLSRAIHWQRYARGPVSALQRGCATDIARGALRLWSEAGGIPEPVR